MLKIQFIQKIKNKFPENLNKYNYDLLPKIFMMKDKQKIYCNDCNVFFEQNLSQHLLGQNCPKCNNKSKIKRLTLTTESFLEKIKNKFPENFDKYDYSKVEYFTSKTPIKIFCRKHGLFEQLPQTHLQGHGCPNCGIIKSSVKNQQQAKSIDKNRVAHGWFEQSISSHFKCNEEYSNCSTEGITKIQKEVVEFIKNLMI